MSILCPKILNPRLTGLFSIIHHLSIELLYSKTYNMLGSWARSSLILLVSRTVGQQSSSAKLKQWTHSAEKLRTMIPHRMSSSMTKKPSDNDQARKSENLPSLKPSAVEIIKKRFPEFFREDKFFSRQTNIDFCKIVLDSMEDLEIEKDLDAYKFLLRLFETGKYKPKSDMDLGDFSALHQYCAIDILNAADRRRVKIDREVQKIVESAFSKHSKVWLTVCRMTYWDMKLRNMNPNPLPEVISEKPIDLACIALERLSDDVKSVITKIDTSSVPGAVDHTWLVELLSPTQKSIIERLPPASNIHIETAGPLYVKDKSLSYFTMKVYDTQEEAHRNNPEADQEDSNFNYNTLKVQFYGKPISEKLREDEERYHVDDHYILGMAISGTCSEDSAKSWIKSLEKECPNIANMNVLFKLDVPTGGDSGGEAL